MNRTIRESRAGQTIIILAIALTAIVAISALAIDGGMAFLDKRRIQVAADAAALAGAHALESLPLPNYSPAHTTAIQVAVDNLPGTTVPGSIGTTATLSGVSLGNNYTMDITGNVATTGWDTYQVTITHYNPTFFAPAIGFTSGTIKVVASAKALSGTYPFAMIVLNDQQSQFPDLFLSGTPATLQVQNGNSKGGVFSNEGLDFNGTGSSIQLWPCGTSGDVYWFNPSSSQSTSANTHIYGYYGAAAAAAPTSCALPAAGQEPKTSSVQLPFPNYPEPAVKYTSSSTNMSSSGSGNTYYMCPGTYTGTISLSGSNTIVLYPGVYRFTNTITLNGGTFTVSRTTDYPFPGVAGGAGQCNGAGQYQVPNTRPSDYGVILEFFPTNCTTNYFSVSGGGSVTLTPSPAYNNISIYVELYNHIAYPTFQASGNCPPSSSGSAFGGAGKPGGTNVVNLAGSGTYSITGALYGPGDNMTVFGTSGGTGVGQVIAWTFQVGGSGTVTENYSAAYLPYFRGLIQ